MAEQPINKDEFIKAGAINSIIEEFDKWKAKLQEIDVLIDKLGKSAPIIQPPKNTEDLNKLLTKIEQLEGALKEKSETEKKLSAIEIERAKLAKQIEAAEAKKVIALNRENKELLELRAETNKLNKEQRDNIKTAERQSNAYFKLSDSTRDYKNESKRLGAELLLLEKNGKRNTQEYRELALSYARVTKQAQLGDAQLKKLDKTVGDNYRSVGAYENATRKLSSALGTLGIAFGLSTVIRNATGIVSNFNQAQVDLQAISGKSAEELTGLTQQAKDLGATTQFSATQITELQIELAKLGFTTQEITDSTGGIANFAAATGVEIPRAAALAGSALRAFNLDATEIDRVVSTLGVATTKTALDFAQLEAGLSTVAPVAASFGFSIEDTTALLGQLANAGFDASSSATATRNILLNLADANGALAKELGRPIKSADDLAAGLQELQAKGIDLASALELTDKRSVAAFSTFITGSKDLVSLRDSITDVNDELTEMADKRIKSVQGAMLLLESAWEGFILDLNESIGASEAFQTVIKFIADNLTAIVKWIGRAVVAYGAYRLTLIAVNAQQAIADKGLKNIIKGFFSLKKAADDGAKAISGAGKALKSIAWTALIAVAIELAVAFYDIASGAREARRAKEEFDNYAKASDENANKRIKERNDRLEEQITKERQLTDIAKSKAKTEKEASDLELAFLNKKQELIDKNNKAILNDIKSVEKRKQGYEELNNMLSAQFKEYERLKDAGDRVGANRVFMQMQKDAAKFGKELGLTNTAWLGLIESNVTYNQVQSNLAARIEATNVKLEIYNKELEESNKNLSESQTNLIVDANERENNRSKIEAQAKALKDLNKKLEDQRKAYQSLIDLEDDLWFRNLGDEDQEVVKRMQQLDDEMAKIDADTIMRAEDREALRKALIEDSEKDIQAIRDKFEKERIDKENEAIRLEKERIKQAELERIQRLEEQALLDKEFRTNELLKSKLSKDEFDKRSLDSEIKYLEELIKIRKDAGLKTIDLENQLLELRKNAQDKAKKAFIDSVTSSVTLLKGLYSDEIDRAIESQNRLIANSQRTIDSLKQAAMAGNEQAKESILAEEKAIEEAQKRIEKAQKRKQRMELISTGINTFNSKVASGKTGLQALGETGAEMTGLITLLKALPSFDVGADRLQSNGKGIDGKGGFLAINHPDERIITAEQNAIIGYHHKNSDIAKVMSYYNKGLLKPISDIKPMVIQQNDNSELLRSINEGFSKINNYNMSFEQLFSTFSLIIEKRKNGDVFKTKKSFKI